MIAPQSKKAIEALVEKKYLKHGLRITRLRRIILDILIESKTHLTIKQIYYMACDDNDDFALASVYRSIHAMVEIGLIEFHQFKKGPTLYEIFTVSSQDHLIDLDSGQVIKFQNIALNHIKAEIAKEHGFRIDDCRIEFYAHPLEKNQSL